LKSILKYKKLKSNEIRVAKRAILSPPETTLP